MNEPTGYDDTHIINQKDIKNPLKPTLAQKKATQKTQELATKMTESFNNYFIDREDNDDLFIKPSKPYKTESFMNDTDNSLIPTIVDLSSYEQSSDNETSN